MSKFSIDMKDPKVQVTLSLYDEPHRKYHNGEHVLSMLLKARSGKVKYINPIQLFIAIVYHDAIYKVGDPNNELNSADLFKAHHGVDKPGHKEIYDAILSTKHHYPVGALSKVLIDLDLWDLRHPNKAQIEYNTTMLFDESGISDWNEFKQKNIAFLNSYADRIGNSVEQVKEIINSMVAPLD
jgi:predicted metal-dependent HD superfamily phosphohydrolase